MQKIFMVLLGGKAPKAKVEVHDIAFVLGKTIEETYPSLSKGWFGLKGKVHIDAYREVNFADGYQISLNPLKRADEEAKLYFIQMGGYTPNIFGENHNYELIVAHSLKQAKARAKSLFFTEQYLPHVDACMDIDEIIEINEIEGHKIYLQKHEGDYPQDKIHTCYIPLPEFSVMNF